MSTAAVSSNSKTSAPTGGPVDSGAREALDALPKEGPINAEQVGGAILKATEDPDNQAAGLEHTDILKWAHENWDRLTPEAKKVVEAYDKAALEQLAKHSTGIPEDRYQELKKEIEAHIKNEAPKEKPGTDASVSKELAKIDNSDGPVTGKQVEDLLRNGVGDKDGEAAGVEFAQIQKWAAENRSRLTPEAQKILDAYEKVARQAQASGKTGIADSDFKKLLAEAHTIANPTKYHDESAGKAIEDLKHKKGIIGGEDFLKALTEGTQDADNEAAGTEFADFQKFVDKNKGRLSGTAKEIYDLYEKYVRDAQAQGHTGITPEDYKKFQAEAKGILAKHNHHDDHHGHHTHRA